MSREKERMRGGIEKEGEDARVSGNRVRGGAQCAFEPVFKCGELVAEKVGQDEKRGKYNQNVRGSLREVMDCLNVQGARVENRVGVKKWGLSPTSRTPRT